MIVVRPVELADHKEWLSMRMALWPDCPADEHAAEIGAYAAAGECQATFVADIGLVCGFVEVSFRQNAEGCTTNPVGYIEGIYVKPVYRRHGVGRALVAAAERWAASLGCAEMASDCLFDNLASELFHRELGYSVTERLIHFRRSLSK